MKYNNRVVTIPAMKEKDFMAKVLAVIPVRGGSKGAQRENLKLFNNKPVIWYAIQSAINSELLDLTIVSTEDPVIADYVKGLDVEVVPRVPVHTYDESVIISSIRETLKYVEDRLSFEPDTIVYINPGSPLITASTLDKVVRKMNAGQCDSIFGATIEFDSPKQNIGRWEFQKDSTLKSLYDHLSPKRKQSFQQKYYIVENNSIYAFKKDVLINLNSFIGEKPCCHVMTYEESINVDDPEDFVKAEILYRHLFKESL